MPAGGEGGDRGWVGWMALLTLQTWVWVNSRRSEGQGSLVRCSPWGSKDSDTTEHLNNEQSACWTVDDQWMSIPAPFLFSLLSPPSLCSPYSSWSPQFSTWSSVCCAWSSSSMKKAVREPDCEGWYPKKGIWGQTHQNIQNFDLLLHLHWGQGQRKVWNQPQAGKSPNGTGRAWGLLGVQGKSIKEFLTWGETQETWVSFCYSLAIDFGKSSSSLDLDFPTCKMA